MHHDAAAETGPDNRTIKYIAYTALCAVAFSVQPFLRRGFGRHYFQMQAVMTIPVLVLLSMVSGPAHLYPLLGFLVAMLTTCALHRISGYRSLSMTNYQHTRYDGWPLLASVLPFSEKTVKRSVEPLVTVLIGFVFAPVSVVLSGYLMLAGFLNAMFTIQRDALFEHRTRQMNDRLMEQRELSRRLRAMQSEADH
jgi:hypothetical protein